MEMRTLEKSNADKYNKLDAEIRRECQTENEMMLTAQYEKIEQLEAAHKSDQVHVPISQATVRNQSVTTYIEDKEGNIIMDQDKMAWTHKRALWRQQRGDSTGAFRKRINASYQKRGRVCSKRHAAEQSSWVRQHLYRKVSGTAKWLYLNGFLKI